MQTKQKHKCLKDLIWDCHYATLKKQTGEAFNTDRISGGKYNTTRRENKGTGEDLSLVRFNGICEVCCQNVWPPLTPAQKIALQQRKRELERGGWMGVCQKLKIPQAAAAIFTAERISRMRGDEERSCENFRKTKWKENSDGVGVEGTSPPSSFTAHRRLGEKKTEDIVNCSCLVTWFVWWTDRNNADTFD